jgi:hypothetical protein
MVVSEGVESQAGLAELADALDSPSPGFALGQRGQEEGGQDGNDRDDTEQFDERKGAPAHGISRRLVA